MLVNHGFDATSLSSIKGVKKFNAFFIGHTRSSAEYVQSPANWQLRWLSDSLARESDLIVACKIKWAFRVKPDIVIHADNQHSLCIELKLDSLEGYYPAASAEKQILVERGLFAAGHTKPFPIYQRDLQKFLMRDLLGLDCSFRFITRSNSSDSDCLTWSNLLEALKPLPDLPLYMHTALEMAGHLPPIAELTSPEEGDALEE
jgi:hypothetical protein